MTIKTVQPNYSPMIPAGEGEIQRWHTYSNRHDTHDRTTSPLLQSEESRRQLAYDLACKNSEKIAFQFELKELV
jgi:hypothetical protein